MGYTTPIMQVFHEQGSFKTERFKARKLHRKMMFFIIDSVNISEVFSIKEHKMCLYIITT